MKALNKALVLFLAISLNGCANLAEVREFANQSAKLSAYTDLTTHFRDTYQRQQPYLIGAVANKIALENNQRRQAAYSDLIKLHNSVVLYMQTLAKLAGENTFDVSKNIGTLSGNIKTHNELGINEKEVDAVSNIAKIIAKWATTAYQEKAVKDMVAESNDSLQIVLASMQTITRSYKGVHENEKKGVVDDFLKKQIELHEKQASSDQLLLAWGRSDYLQKASYYKTIEPQYDLLTKGISDIAKGHKKLTENINNLSGDDIKNELKTIAQDIKTIADNIGTINSNNK